MKTSRSRYREVNRIAGPVEGNTSHPILAIGNTHDTVTPLRK